MDKTNYNHGKKYNYLEDVQKSNTVLDSIYAISIKFEHYEIENGYIYGRGKKENVNANKLFKRHNKIDLLMKLLNIGKLIYNENIIKKNVFETYEFNNEVLEKPHILVDIEKLTLQIKEKIKDFFEIYGIIQADRYDLTAFIRRTLDLYCTVEIWHKIEEKKIYEEDLKDLIYILYPQYRKLDKDSLCMGIATNLQEKGLFKYERSTFVMYEFFSYNSHTHSYQILNVCNDYITLAYHQLIQTIINKNNGNILPKCIYCGDYFDYERSSKKYCDSDECRKRSQRERTRKSREDKKRREKII